VNIAMSPDVVLAAAKQNDANTAEALKAAQDAVKALVVLKGTRSSARRRRASPPTPSSPRRGE
jgi:hypothetical protein